MSAGPPPRIFLPPSCLRSLISAQDLSPWTLTPSQRLPSPICASSVCNTHLPLAHPITGVLAANTTTVSLQICKFSLQNFDTCIFILYRDQGNYRKQKGIPFQISLDGQDAFALPFSVFCHTVQGCAGASAGDILRFATETERTGERFDVRR